MRRRGFLGLLFGAAAAPLISLPKPVPPLTVASPVINVHAGISGAYDVERLARDLGMHLNKQIESDPCEWFRANGGREDCLSTKGGSRCTYCARKEREA